MLNYFANGYRHLTERVPADCQPNWEFLAVIDGRTAPIFEEADRPELRERTLWIFSPQCRHGWIADPREPFSRIVFHFGFVPHALEALVHVNGGYVSKRLTGREIAQLKAIAAELEPHYERPNELSPLHFERRLVDLSLLALAGSKPKPQRSLYNAALVRVEDAVAWYGEHLSQSPSVVDVAKAMRVSPSHLRRLFWKVRRASPKSELRKVRVHKAQELMSRSTRTLESIAGACGFTDASHLCREYRALNQFTPTFWRRRKVVAFAGKQPAPETAASHSLAC